MMIGIVTEDIVIHPPPMVINIVDMIVHPIVNVRNDTVSVNARNNMAIVNAEKGRQFTKKR